MTDRAKDLASESLSPPIEHVVDLPAPGAPDADDLDMLVDCLCDRTMPRTFKAYADALHREPERRAMVAALTQMWSIRIPTHRGAAPASSPDPTVGWEAEVDRLLAVADDADRRSAAARSLNAAPRLRPTLKRALSLFGGLVLGSGWVAFYLEPPPIPGARPLHREHAAAMAAQYADLGVGTNWYQVRTIDWVRLVVLPDHSTVLVRDSSTFRFWGDSAAVMVGEVEGEIVLDIPEGRAWLLDAGFEPLRLAPGRYAIVNRRGHFQLAIAHGRVISEGDTSSWPPRLGSGTATPDQPRWWGWERATTPIVTASVVHESAGVTDSVAPATVPTATAPTQPRQSVARELSALPIDSPERICGTAADRIRIDEGLSRANAAHIIVLRDCPDHAAEIVPALWGRPVTDDDIALQQLIRVSREIHDGRIERALFAAVADETKPVLIRQAALGTLTSYLHPRLVTWVAPHPTVSRDYQVAVAWAATPVESKQGAVPLSPDVRERVRELLYELGGRGDADPVGQIANRALTILSSVGGGS